MSLSLYFPALYRSILRHSVFIFQLFIAQSFVTQTLFPNPLSPSLSSFSLYFPTLYRSVLRHSVFIFQPFIAQSFVIQVDITQQPFIVQPFRHSPLINRVQELCESRGGHPGLPVLTSLTVSVDVTQHWTMLRHWSQFVPNMSTDIRGHWALHHHHHHWSLALNGHSITHSFSSHVMSSSLNPSSFSSSPLSSMALCVRDVDSSSPRELNPWPLAATRWSATCSPGEPATAFSGCWTTRDRSVYTYSLGRSVAVLFLFVTVVASLVVVWFYDSLIVTLVARLCCCVCCVYVCGLFVVVIATWAIVWTEYVCVGGAEGGGAGEQVCVCV